MKKQRIVSISTGGGGPAEPVLQLNPCDCTTKNLSGKAEPVASATLGLRLALNATARACNQERGLACRALDSAQGKPCSVALLGLAFTMAEILLSLTIIGVVAAITLPSLTGNINERTWNTQRKALYARFSQAIALMPALNGYGTLREETDSAGSISIEDTAAETFVTSGLAKVLKINNICDSEHLEDCGINSTVVTLNGSTIDTPKTMSELNPHMTDNTVIGGGFGVPYKQLDTKAAAFETQNGESILAFYNPNCQPAMGETSNYAVQPKICLNFIFDMNGNKGPNTVGKDIGFMSVLYPTDSAVVAPNIPVQRASSTANQQDAMSICKEQDPEFRIPSQDELASMFVNQRLINGEMVTGSTNYWSATLYDSTRAWTQGFSSGGRLIHARSSAFRVHCVKR